MIADGDFEKLCKPGHAREGGMTAIEKIVTKLQRHPSVQYSVAGCTLTVEPLTEDGFSVWLHEQPPAYTVGFDGWHEHFQDEAEALAAFAFGLSDACRLQVMQRGRMDCAWTVESQDEHGEWKVDSTTGLLFTPFWRRRRVVYRQNHLITRGGDFPG